MVLHTIDTPKAIKSKFSDYLTRLERKSKKRLDAYFEELIKAMDIAGSSKNGGVCGRPMVNLGFIGG